MRPFALRAIPCRSLPDPCLSFTIKNEELIDAIFFTQNIFFYVLTSVMPTSFSLFLKLSPKIKKRLTKSKNLLLCSCLDIVLYSGSADGDSVTGRYLVIFETASFNKLNLRLKTLICDPQFLDYFKF